MPSRTKIKVFHSLLHYSHMKHAKDDLLAGYNVESSLDLNDKELDQLIDYLKSIINKKDQEVSEQKRKLMHQCLKIMSDIGINTQEWNDVNKFMLNKHVCGRHLYELNEQDLIAFKRKLYAIRKKVSEIKEKELLLSTLN